LVSGIIVKDSRISGNGIFAAHAFRKGELVIEWCSHEILAKQEMERVSEKVKEHISFIDGAFVVVPPEGRVNHSCEANVYLRDYCYYASRDIEEGEEITADYRLESEPGFRMKCNCKSKSCRGYISV
jgi:SET domain-containing protein